MKTRKMLSHQKAFLFVLSVLVCFGMAYGDAYDDFNSFCAQKFGAEKEPLAYQKFGTDLKMTNDGYWKFISVNSACIAWETNLPAKTYVEYGTTTAYGNKAWADTSRWFYIHVQYVTGLAASTDYHFRLVSTDERGNTVMSGDSTFTTKASTGMLRIPEDVTRTGARFVLNQSGKTYVVSSDLTLDSLGFDLAAANITLDLGGHTVIYDNVHQGACTGPGDFWEYINRSSFGVRAMSAGTGFKLYNGKLKQGAGNDSAQANSIGFSPVYLNGSTGEISGITVEYTGVQLSGIYTHWADNNVIHHNIVMDRGTEITDRHQAVRAIGRGSKSHHNLIKRSRQQGINAGSACYDNEIYTDSYSTNSIAVNVDSGVTCHGNRVFGTGYHVVAFGTPTSRDTFCDNFVHLEGCMPQARWSEYGDQVSLNGFRLTQYNGGTTAFNDLLYYNNVVSINSIEGNYARGCQFFSDPYVKNLTFRNNIIKVIDVDGKPKGIIGCIVAQGQFARVDEVLPIYYRDNDLISNICNVMYGDDYGSGWKHEMYNCHFTKTGTNPNYSTIKFNQIYGYATKMHMIQDASFSGSASPLSVDWGKLTGQSADYTLQYTMKVIALPTLPVSVSDAKGAVVFTGTIGADSTASTVCVQMKRTPAGDSVYTPHRVWVNSPGTFKIVTMDSTRVVNFLKDTVYAGVSAAKVNAEQCGRLLVNACERTAHGVSFFLEIPQAGLAEIGVYNILGQKIWANQIKTVAGIQSILWPNAGQGTGSYFVTLKQGMKKAVGRFIIAK